MMLSPEGEALIKRFESCAKKRPDGLFEAYPDPGTGGDPWTLGWGSTGPDIKQGTVWTQDQCDQRFAKHIQSFVADVNTALDGAPTTQNQFDALTSFHYNTGAIFKATLTKLHKAGKFDLASNEFLKWNKAAGKILPGLTKRREAECALYRRANP